MNGNSAENDKNFPQSHTATATLKASSVKMEEEPYI